MKIQNVKFIKSAESLADCPAGALAEFAFIGRSNVGKSSLINWLTNQNGLARVSKTPGRTREINFFSIDDSWSLVDLPGYGFAKVSKAQQQRFNEFVSDYLLNRTSLLGTFQLVDSRHAPQKIDLEFTTWLVESEIPFALVFTKADKSKSKVLEKNRSLYLGAMSKFSEGSPVVFTTSVNAREGRKDLLDFIGKAIQAVG